MSEDAWLDHEMRLPRGGGVMVLSAWNYSEAEWLGRSDALDILPSTGLSFAIDVVGRTALRHGLSIPIVGVVRERVLRLHWPPGSRGHALGPFDHAGQRVLESIACQLACTVDIEEPACVAHEDCAALPDLGRACWGARHRNPGIPK